jgi:hypothetical protein
VDDCGEAVEQAPEILFDQREGDDHTTHGRDTTRARTSANKTIGASGPP